MNPILEKLSGGDLRSEGKASEVAKQVLDNPDLFTDLMTGLESEEKLIRGRTCMTLEIVSRSNPELLKKVIPRLIAVASIDTVPQIRWHLAEIFGNVPVSGHESEKLIAVLTAWLKDKSKIVQYCTVETLGIVAKGSSRQEEIIQILSSLKSEGKSLTRAVTLALDNLEMN